MRLGKRQLELLRGIPATAAMIVPDKVALSLVRLGLMRLAYGDGWACITPAGLRALADAAENGRVTLFRGDTIRVKDPAP